MGRRGRGDRRGEGGRGGRGGGVVVGSANCQPPVKAELSSCFSVRVLKHRTDLGETSEFHRCSPQLAAEFGDNW